MKAALLWLRAVLLSLLVYCFARINDSAKCKACGIVARHKIWWNNIAQMVLHQCGRCGAVWGDKPLVDPKKWAEQRPKGAQEAAPAGQQDTDGDTSTVWPGPAAPPQVITRSGAAIARPQGRA